MNGKSVRVGACLLVDEPAKGKSMEKIKRYESLREYVRPKEGSCKRTEIKA